MKSSIAVPTSLLLLRAFFFLLLFKSVFEFPENVFGITVSKVYQYTNLSLVLLTFMFTIVNARVYLTNLCLAFLVFGLFGLFNGLASQTANLKMLANLYYYWMPALMLSFGSGLYINHRDEAALVVERITKASWLALFLIHAAFFLLWFAGLWRGMSFSSGILITVLYMRTTSMRFGISFLLEFLSLKRTTMILALFILLRRLGIVRMLALVFLVLVPVYIFQIDIPSRVSDVFELGGLPELYKATGGRSAEWVAIYKKFAEQPSRVFYGFGFGAVYTSYDVFNSANFDVRHYSHALFVSYFFLSGIFVSAYFLVAVGNIALKCWMIGQPLSMIVVLFCVGSLAGAALHVEPLPWILIGYFIKYFQSNAA
ncbi:hypothetical protein N9Y91_01220 [Alphaproteobacteria bacterium]|nr:hypothetical protein [Alphaproteobacteria bacterium]